MRKPDKICRVCRKTASHSSFGDVCSKVCAERLSETEYYELEAGEAVAELCEFEEGVYLPLFLRLGRAEAKLRVLQVGASQLLRSDRLTESPGESTEVQEWKRAQSQEDKYTVSLVKGTIRRLRKRVRRLEEELSEIDKRWQSLSARKDATLKKLSTARGE
jgi:hypothetical protein